MTLCLITSLALGEDPQDTYYYQAECPENGKLYEKNDKADEYGFIRCQCVSYVADQLSRIFSARWWEHRGQADIMTEFINNRYYMPQSYEENGRVKTVEKWSHAVHWMNSALRAGIGVTGARDNFVWDEKSYNAVFRGDVAWWNAWVVKDSNGKEVEEKSNRYGHVAFVESAEKDAYGKGVSCVTITEYNWSPRHNFNKRRVCKKDRGNVFPDMFLHIDKDHAYCINHPDDGNCPTLFGKQAGEFNGKGNGIGGGSDFFNLKPNSFYVTDVASSVLEADVYELTPGQSISVKMQVKATGGDTQDHMRARKTKIEVDLYQRQGMGEWIYIKRTYIKVANLDEGDTHTETATITVPQTNGASLSFKAKVDAEDEAMEANESDNWTTIETFQVANAPPPKPNFISTGFRFTQTPSYAGDQARFGAWITNVGNIGSPADIRSSYSVECPGTGRVYLADDGTQAGTLTAGASAFEENVGPVTLPNIAGNCTAYFCADYQNAVAESNESDNCATLSFALQPRPKPNLVITKFRDESGCCTTNTGSRIKPDIWIKNTGPVSPASEVFIRYSISSPVATGGAWWEIGYGVIRPSELPPGGTDEDYMEGNGYPIPKNSAWKNQWHTVRACLRADGSYPANDPNQGDVCATYSRYSKK